MTRTQARLFEYGIIGLCLIALVLVFQPFVLKGYTVGAVLVIVGGLAFNAVPFCREGVAVSRVLRVLGIVLLILIVVASIAIGSAYLYGIYFVGA